MFLSYRALVVCAKEKGVPAEDVLRFARPKNFVKLLDDVKKACSSKAADEGLAFFRMMSNKWKGPVRPALSWKREVSANNAGPPVSDRATGVIKSAVDVVDAIKDSRREAVFGREALPFYVRAMYLGLASRLRKTLAPMLPDVPDAVDLWVDTPWAGEWPFELSRRGCKVKPGREEKEQVQGWRSDAGRIQRRRHVVLVIRGVTQLACRLQNVDNSACAWLLRATHSSDESRFPF